MVSIKSRKRSKAQKDFVTGNWQAPVPKGYLWKPHPIKRDCVVAVKYHLSPSGIGIEKGHTISFTSQFYRDNWLARQYPRRYGKLASKTL